MVSAPTSTRNVANSEDVQGNGNSMAAGRLLPPALQCSPLPFPHQPLFSPLSTWQEDAEAHHILGIMGAMSFLVLSPGDCHLLSGSQFTAQHKWGPHQALLRAESREFSWLLVHELDVFTTFLHCSPACPVRIMGTLASPSPWCALQRW